MFVCRGPGLQEEGKGGVRRNLMEDKDADDRVRMGDGFMEGTDVSGRFGEAGSVCMVCSRKGFGNYAKVEGCVDVEEDFECAGDEDGSGDWFGGFAEYADDEEGSKYTEDDEGEAEYMEDK
ncbi:hypothetical protein LTR17_026926 [Elasticomyces elasticus]|nr:hypothetical protein LTR17_026926 [Elasticomyces elasticus]